MVAGCFQWKENINMVSKNTYGIKPKHSYEYDVNKITSDQMVIKLGMSTEEADTLLAYRERFKIFEDNRNALIDLNELWEALDKPYTDLARWKSSVVVPLSERIKSVISDKIQKAKGRGRPKQNSFITIELAKHLAMTVNNEAGDLVRQYFITVEKCFNSMVTHNALRIDLHDTGKQFYSSTLKLNNFNKDKAGAELVKLNTITKAVSGGRNELKTKLDRYGMYQAVIADARLRGKSFAEIENALK
jgi:phage anti-repressor protein